MNSLRVAMALGVSISSALTAPTDVRAQATGLADALLYPAPADSLAHRLRGFGRLVGSWDVEVTYRPADGPTETVPGEWHVGWILEGRAVQDVWRVPRHSTVELGPLRGLGTTVRIFDPSIGAWRSTWISARGNSVTSFIGREDGGDIYLTPELAPDEEPYRWVFFEIASDTFRWRAESAAPGGTWIVEQEMVARRAPARRGTH